MAKKKAKKPDPAEVLRVTKEVRPNIHTTPAETVVHVLDAANLLGLKYPEVIAMLTEAGYSPNDIAFFPRACQCPSDHFLRFMAAAGCSDEEIQKADAHAKQRTPPKINDNEVQEIVAQFPGIAVAPTA